MGINKRGVFFSSDAILAMSIIFLVLLIALPSIILVLHQPPQTEVHRDILGAFSSLKVGYVNDTYTKELIASNIITNPNNTILEQIGEFYVTNYSLAQEFANQMLVDVNTNQNIGIWYENRLIASINKTPIESAENVETARQIISGIKEGSSVTGFSARAFLLSASKNDFIFYGGYVGDGAITSRVEYQGTLKKVEMELAINDDFDVYVNGINVGSFQKSPSVYTPIDYDIPIGNFSSGVNTLQLKNKNGNLLGISGGFIKLSYNTENVTNSGQRYYFPGVDGLINIYDGFYIPQNLSSVNIFLHINSGNVAFLNIGNTTVFRNSTQGEQTFSISNSQLSSQLNYQSLVGKTVPLRLGLENVSYFANYSLYTDVFSVTDLSSSMNSNIPSLGVKMISLARNANSKFVEIMLTSPFNRVGLVGYNTEVTPDNYHALSNDSNSLNNSINAWTTKAGNCVCCGVINATQSFASQSSSNKFKFMVVMTDGSMQGTCYSGSNSATADAIRASCEAYDNYNITSYTVGFGDGADSTTLQAMAQCGRGNYYHSSVDEIVNIYSKIANDIINASYAEQTLKFTGNFTTKLFSDSILNLITLNQENLMEVTLV